VAHSDVVSERREAEREAEPGPSGPPAEPPEAGRAADRPPARPPGADDPAERPRAQPPGAPDTGGGLAPFATRPVLTIAAVTGLAMLVLSARYGYHRDEPYYLVGGARPAWGYVDHPPVVPVVMHLVDVLTGHTLVGLRALASVLTMVGVVAGALVARELGGDGRAQVLAAAVCALAPTLRGPNELVGTTGFDYAVWVVLLVLFARLLRTGAPRWWLPIGVVAGIGLETKWTVLVLLAGMALGVVVERRWDLLRSPWLLAGGAVALAAWIPNLVWNARHDWATIEFQQAVRDDNAGLGGRIEFVVGQLLISGIVTVIVWWPGLWWLLRADGPRRWARTLGVTAVAVVGLLFVSGAKFYYAGPVYVMLLAAGCVVLAGAPDSRRRTALAVVALGALVSLPLTTPVLPTSALNAVIPVQKEVGEMVGWPDYVAQVRAVVAGLPPATRERTVVLTGSYAEAAFLERDAPELRVYSGHNSYWWWGPPPDTATGAVVVGYREAGARSICADPVAATRIANGAGIHNDEEGQPVWTCDRLVGPWSALWPGLKHYG
jgi:hypothetical protein